MTDLAAALLRDVRPEIEKAIYDPGTTEGYKGDRTLTAWQTDAVMRAVLAALSAHLDPALAEQVGEVVEALRFSCLVSAPGHSAATVSDLLTALLTANAALRAQVDALRAEAFEWRDNAMEQMNRATKASQDAEAAEAREERLREAALKAERIIANGQPDKIADAGAILRAAFTETATTEERG